MEQSSLESQSRGCAKTPILTVFDDTKFTSTSCVKTTCIFFTFDDSASVHEISYLSHVYSRGICLVHPHLFNLAVSAVYGQRLEQGMDQTGKVANPFRGQLNRVIFYCLCLRIRSRDTGSAVPSLANPLVLHAQAESGANSRIPPVFRDGVHIDYTVNRHRVSPELMGSRNCVPMALTIESPLAQYQ